MKWHVHYWIRVKFDVNKSGPWWVLCAKEGPVYERWESDVKATSDTGPCVYEMHCGQTVHDTMVQANT
ncbi:hypothetical protein HanRHA438_Chr05g0235861 [Helianthus annuus]|nr:hypothetical protein HanRHA438_Chr05g0235861 [Helianthus annuus]